MQAALPKGVGRKIWWAASKKRERERQRKTTREELWDDCRRRRRTEIAIVSRSLWLPLTPPHHPPLSSMALFRTLCPQQLHADSINNSNKNNNSFVSRSCPAACSACCSPHLLPHFSPLRRTSPRLVSSSSSTIFNVDCREFSVFSFQFILNSRCERIEPHATTR